jgi:hypothetical protein
MFARLLEPTLTVVALTGCTFAPPSATQAPASGATPTQALNARIVAVGVPGAAGYHAGRPVPCQWPRP